jgi:hypothetical protein
MRGRRARNRSALRGWHDLVGCPATTVIGTVIEPTVSRTG